MSTSQKNASAEADHGILAKSNSYTDRRRQRRYRPRLDTVVYNGEIFGQLLDISTGGLSFVYSREQNKINDVFFELDLMCSNQDLGVRKVLCKSVMDLAHSRVPGAQRADIRRRCVQFSALTPEQTDQIKRYLRTAASEHGRNGDSGSEYRS